MRQETPSYIQHLKKLFRNWSQTDAVFCEPLPIRGLSNRQYWRLCDENGASAIGVHNADRRENDVFTYLTKHFTSAGISVQKLYCEDLDNGVYLEENLGDVTLFDMIGCERTAVDFPKTLIDMYSSTAELLAELQVIGGKELDYSHCLSRSEFDAQSMRWDLDYFKYFFVKLSGTEFDEQRLEDDVKTFISFLTQNKFSFFLHRDFHSRNIMIHNGKPYVIDYQGGKKGALQYDLASLLFDAKADIPFDVRDSIFEAYLIKLRTIHSFDEKVFRECYWGFALIRIMYSMGVYGFRGLFQKRSGYAGRLIYVIKNLKWLIQNMKLPIHVPELSRIWVDITQSESLKTMISETRS